MTGARAKVYANEELVGIYESCTYNANFGNEAVHILGRFSPDEIVITSSEAVPVNCSGFRVIGSGVHKLPKVPKLQDLLNLENITLVVSDRQTGEITMTLVEAKVTGHSGGVQARATSKVSVSYLGTKMADEEGDQDESAGAASLPNVG